MNSYQHGSQNLPGTATTPRVAVVILNWNGRGYLEKFLPSVLSSTYVNLEIVVADNASVDDSLDWLAARYPTVTVVRNERNYGFAGGYNRALKKVQADIYVLLNSDVEVSPEWIEPVVELLSNDPGIAACQPKMLAFNDKRSFEYAGACGGWLDNFGYPFSRGRVFDHCETDHGQYNQPIPCFWASGAALFIRAGIFHALGGFDEHFFAHQEEIDLCWRIQAAGYRVYVQPKSVVWHVGGGTLPKGNSLKTYLNFRNNLLMLYKNMPFTEAIWKIPVRFCLDAVAAWKALLGGDSGFFLAVMKAHIRFFPGMFSVNRQKRKKRGKDLDGLYHGSIVWQYFLKKRREFSQIVGNK